MNIRNKNILLELVLMVVPAADTIIIPVISEVLEKNPGLGANKLRKEATPLYYEKTGGNKLHQPHFFKYLGIMKSNGLVEALGSGKSGKKMELYLTEAGKRQYRQQSFEQLISTESPVSTNDGISPELKALYAIILYFNHGLSYAVYSEDALEHILRSFGLSLSSLIVRSEKSIVKSDSEDIMRDVFQSPKEDATVFKDVFLRSDLYEKGTKRYRLLLRGITCEAVLENRQLKAFRYFGFTSENIRSAIIALCDLNILTPMGSMGLKINDEVIYKVEKSIFDLMFGLHSLNDYDIFDKIESVMKNIWSSFRLPTPEEKNWLCFVYGNKEADRIINDAHDSRVKITNGKSMALYISSIRRNDKEKLSEMNNRIDITNKEISMINSDMVWIQESYQSTINRHQILLNNIFETVYPKFFANLSLEKFGAK